MSEHPPEGTVEAWVQAARRMAGGGPDLLHETIAEAAFWRRAYQLDPELTSRDVWAEPDGAA